MKAIYPGSGDGDPLAVPGVQPRDQREPGLTELTLEVDGELFAVRPDEDGGTGYIWVSGPNPGYGFGVSPFQGKSPDEHRQAIRDFLADIDPVTGYLAED